MAASSPTTPQASGCLALFGVPFALGGCLAVGKLIGELTSPYPNWTQVWPLAICSAAMLTIGFGLIAATIFARKQQRATDALRAASPDSPWMWRADWAQGRVESRSKQTAMFAWVISLFWNSIAIPISYVALGAWNQHRMKNPVVPLILLFPAVGVALLIWAVRATLRRIEFGKTAFAMASVPGPVGGHLRGNIEARFPHGAGHGVKLKLSCVNHIVTGSGKNQTTHEKILWREEKQVPPEALMPGPQSTMIPVDFATPADALPTDTTSPANAILWLLEASADVPGVDYRDTFEIPVFRTKDSPVAQVDRSQAFASVPQGPVERPADAQVEVQHTPGGVIFNFRMGRDVSAAFGATVFFLLWTGVVWFLWTHAPVFFTVVFGLFDLIMFMIVLSLWLGASTVQIEGGKVAVRGGLLGVGRRREWDCSEISDIAMPIRMQTGEASGTPYYDIEFTLGTGQKVTAGKGVRNKQEAEWLIAEMKKAIGLRAKAAAASAEK